MSIRPFRDIKRRKTKKIKVGNIEVGGDSPISVQSMTNTLTTDVKKTIKQINALEEAGADIVRVSCPDQESCFGERIFGVGTPLKSIFDFSPNPKLYTGNPFDFLSFTII